MNKEKLIERYDDNPGEYFGMLCENYESIKLQESDNSYEYKGYYIINDNKEPGQWFVKDSY